MTNSQHTDELSSAPAHAPGVADTRRTALRSPLSSPWSARPRLAPPPQVSYALPAIPKCVPAR